MVRLKNVPVHSYTNQPRLEEWEEDSQAYDGMDYHSDGQSCTHHSTDGLHSMMHTDRGSLR